nr:MAG TPA: Protein of unknown function (DUF1059) [Caudoviricetes sp.]
MPYLRIDEDIFCTVAICDRCQWRVIAGSPANAWKELALHAKKVHDDRHAVTSALNAKAHHDKRALKQQHSLPQ